MDECLKSYLYNIVQVEEDIEIIQDYFTTFGAPLTLMNELLDQKYEKSKSSDDTKIVEGDPNIVHHMTNNVTTDNVAQEQKINLDLDCPIEPHIRKEIIQKYQYQKVQDPEHQSKPLPIKFDPMPKIRYRNNMIVTSKGEKYV